MRWLWAMALLALSGCAAAAAPAVTNIGSLAGTAAPAATGIFATRSTVELNKATVRLSTEQADLIRSQIADAEFKREQEASKRAAAVGLLKDMAQWRDDPVLSYLAIWVRAGGDPDWAMKYALGRMPSAPVARAATGKIAPSRVKPAGTAVIPRAAQSVSPQ